MSFSDKYNPDGTPKDGAAAASSGELGETDWGSETAAALRDAGFKIVSFGGTGMIYVGQVTGADMPDGHGYMYQSNGDLHEGKFSMGRAHGPGVYVTHSGVELTGSWNENKRMGEFKKINPDGARYTVNYKLDGTKGDSSKDKIEVENADWVEGAVYPEGHKKAGQPMSKTKKQWAEVDVAARQCWNCDGFSRDRNNHAWACRTHKAKWTVDTDYRGDGEKPGIYACCGKTNKADAGCAFEEHHLH